jgi:hypothetical protein
MAEVNIFIRDTGESTYSVLKQFPTAMNTIQETVQCDVPVTITSIRFGVYLFRPITIPPSGFDIQVQGSIQVGNGYAEFDLIDIDDIVAGSYGWYEKVITPENNITIGEGDFAQLRLWVTDYNLGVYPAIQWARQSTSSSFLWRVYGEIYVPDPPGKAQNPTPEHNENKSSGIDWFVSTTLSKLQWEAPD